MTEDDAINMCLFNADIHPIYVKIINGMLILSVMEEDFKSLQETTLFYAGQQVSFFYYYF